MKGSSPPEGWSISTLGSIVSIRNGYAFKSSEFTKKGVSLVKQSNLKGAQVDLSGCAFLPHEYLEEYKRFELVKGDILVGMSGSIGKISIYNEDVPSLQNQRTGKVEISDKEIIDPAFMLRFLSTIERELNSKSKGLAVQNVSAKDIEEIEVPLPPINEQRRIADKLDTALAAVEACKQKLNNAAETIQRFRQSVLAAAVSGELTREWREERGIEGEWKMTALANLVKRIDAGLNLKCDERIPQHEERGLIKISAVTWGEFNEEESKTLPASAEVKEENKIKPGDLLISRANTIELVGSCVIVKGITKNLYLPDKVLRLEAEESLKKWLLINLRSPGGRSQIESLSSGNQLSMRNLSQKNMLSIKLPIPTQEELDQIYRKSDALFDQAATIEEQIQSALSVVSRLTPSLLAKAFRGELVPQDPNDEPASVLLERIKAQREDEAAIKKPAKRGRKKKADAAQLTVPESIADNHLAKVIEECGALTERALLAASELQPGVFQLQLSKELKAGGLKQVDVDGEAAYADAAWEEEL